MEFLKCLLDYQSALIVHLRRATDDLVIALIGSDEESPIGAFQVVACWLPTAFAREAAQLVHAGMDEFTPGLFAWVRDER